ncbi:hypothetical protein H257_17445 [Aphanomyces astaci]|uniref:DUF8040 domain-containing protein n=1 Tax=Aphanomyces astaci TaxID=112090 RepID=W4FEP6_APHAT|nr:hypothetical protein H257_17445 [Aphanomyces astaci]ETV65967.1 hypothetical protein H257_17445 [Aphanomyces astaci]|eukprot:XP_009844546.1 hypothetical protein H257_17445 [Aphanomyces astaci]
MQTTHAVMSLLHRRVYRRRRMLILAYMVYHYSAFLLKSSKRVSILSGALWIAEILNGNEDAFVETFRLSRDTYGGLLFDLVQRGGLRGTRHISPQEQLCLFLYFFGHNASSTNMQQRFQHSGQTISRHLRLIVLALRRLLPYYIRLPPEESPAHRVITTNPKFYPYFENCRMALDGTHIPASKTAPFHDRKGVTMNVLAACDFDLVFTFVLAGWEGSAGDGKPRTKEELFNLRHAQLRNCIERILFGILKMRFPVLSSGVRYDCAFQVDVVLALCVVHNFIRLRGIRNDRFEQEADVQLDAVDDGESNPPPNALPPEEPDNKAAKEWRNSITSRMGAVQWEQQLSR